MKAEIMVPANGWVVKSLEQVANILDSKRIPVNNSERAARIAGKGETELYPYYGATGQVGVIDGYLFDGEYVLLGEDGAPFLDPVKNKAYLVTGKFWVNNHAHILRAKGSNKFLCHYLNHISYEAHVTGTTRLKLTQGALKRIPVMLPSEEVQKDVVAEIETLFSELDKGIECLKTARQQLKAYRQAVLKHAFKGKLTEQWRQKNLDKLESPEQLLARIPQPDQPRGGRQASVEVIEGVAALAVNKPAKVPPESWVWTPLLRVARQETGHTPSRKHPEYWDGDQYWIGIVDARHNHGQVIQDTAQKVTLEGLDNSSARTLPEGTVCLSRTASVGYVCIMGKPMATSQDFATWTCTEALEPKFLMYALMAEGDEIRRFGKGTTHTTIYFPEIRALHICLPSLQEQKVIIEAVEAKLQQASHAWNEIDFQLRKAETLRQTILKKAFSGQLIVDGRSVNPHMGKATKSNRGNAACSQ